MPSPAAPTDDEGVEDECAQQRAVCQDVHHGCTLARQDSAAA